MSAPTFWIGFGLGCFVGPFVVALALGVTAMWLGLWKDQGGRA